MSAFSELMGDLGGQWSRGFAYGMGQDVERQNQAKWAQQAYKDLMPLRLQEAEERAKIAQRYAPRPYTAVPKGSRYLIGPKGIMELPQEPEQASGQNLLSLLTQRVEAPQEPAVLPAQARTPEYGIGEEAASGTVPTTRTMSGEHALLTSLGMNPAEREAVPHIGEKGGMSLSFQKKTAPKPETTEKGADWVLDRDPISGKVQFINRLTREVADVPGAANTAKPPFVWNENTIAAAKAGLLPLPAGTTMQQVEAAEKNLIGLRGASTGARVEAGVDARAKHAQQIGEVTLAQEMAKRDPRVIQRELDKIDRVQQITLKYAPEIEKARNLARPMGEGAQTQARLFENTLRSLDQMRREFTDDDLLRYAGIWNRGENYIAQVAGVDQKFQRFLVLNEHLRSTAFQYGGKQLTPFEAAVVFGFTPHGREIFKEQYLEKMDLLEERTHFELDRVKYLATTPKGEVVPAVPEGTKKRNERRETGSVQPSSVDPLEGRTATGPNGEKIIRRNGTWQPLK